MREGNERTDLTNEFENGIRIIFLCGKERKTHKIKEENSYITL